MILSGSQIVFPADIEAVMLRRDSANAVAEGEQA